MGSLVQAEIHAWALPTVKQMCNIYGNSRRYEEKMIENAWEHLLFLTSTIVIILGLPPDTVLTLELGTAAAEMNCVSLFSR